MPAYVRYQTNSRFLAVLEAVPATLLMSPSGTLVSRSARWVNAAVKFSASRPFRPAGELGRVVNQVSDQPLLRLQRANRADGDSPPAPLPA